ncbi:MAG: glycosyltransferase family 9 protein [Chthoniobacterales bacterium]
MQAEDFAAMAQLAAADPERARDLGSAWMRHMRRGDFARAWDVSDEVLRERADQRCDDLPRHFQWVWRGEPLNDKRVLIRCYHGLGDTIQFIRYAALVRQIASRAIVWAQPALLDLLGTADGIDELLPLHDREPEVDYDVDVESMELPHIFRSTIGTLPNRVPYLHVEPVNLERDGSLQVGLVWECGDWAPERAVPVPLIEQLGEVEGATFHIMQRGPALSRWRNDFGVISGSDNIFEAARVIAALDLMITIDSMPTHLAGALGVPTWTLLQANADWRWMDDREDSPWYPTMRLFRQDRAGDWQSVVRRVRNQLQQLARASADSHRGSRASARD